MKTLRNILLELVVLAALVAAIVFWLRGTAPSLSFASTDVSATDMRIDLIRDIGEWEFLSIHTEEIVDSTFVTPRPWPLPDEKRYLARIYRGTLRLGLNLREDAPEGWIRVVGDSVSVSLPPMRLLDERFVDEARTRPLIEDGKFSDAERKALTERARVQLRRHNLTPENLQRCRQQAVLRMTDLLHGLGYRRVSVK